MCQKMSVSGVHVILQNQAAVTQALSLQLQDQIQDEPKRRVTEPASLKYKVIMFDTLYLCLPMATMIIDQYFLKWNR